MSVKRLEYILVEYRIHWDNKKLFYTVKIII